MLVLSRRRDEAIHIGDEIVVTILKAGRVKVSLGVEAPRPMKIVRVQPGEKDGRNRDVA